MWFSREISLHFRVPSWITVDTIASFDVCKSDKKAWNKKSCHYRLSTTFCKER